MPVIAFSSPKGGCGKTTGAVILATILAGRGASVAVIDDDPNKNVVDWAQLPGRPAGLTVTGDVGEETIVDAIEEAAGRAAFVIIDLEGAANLLVSYAISLADFIVNPMQGSQLDAKQYEADRLARAHIWPLDSLRSPDDARQPSHSAEDAAPYRGPVPRARRTSSRNAPL
jgi:cellulose biosynthesis protein BcsQ